MHLGKGEKKKNGDKQVYYFKVKVSPGWGGNGMGLGGSITTFPIYTHSHLKSWVGRGWLIKIWGPMTS